MSDIGNQKSEGEEVRCQKSEEKGKAGREEKE